MIPSGSGCDYDEIAEVAPSADLAGVVTVGSRQHKRILLGIGWES